MAENPKKKSAAKPKPQTALPEWIKQTPYILYTLEACPSTGGDQQEIEMSLEHYEILKRELARLQGYSVPAEAKNA